MKYFIGTLLFSALSAYAMPTLPVPEEAWTSLSPAEKSIIQEQYLIESVPANSYGLLIDNQGVDRSTPGSNAGTALGSAAAQTAYLDRAINHGNYSAKTQLGVAIIGALVGASFDQPGQLRYQIRYAVKLADGTINYHDIVSAEPFRHPAGACVMIPSIDLAGNQNLCTITAESLRQKYISRDESTPKSTDTSLTRPKSATEMITCKIGTQSPVSTSLEKCNLINGKVLND